MRAIWCRVDVSRPNYPGGRVDKLVQGKTPKGAYPGDKFLHLAAGYPVIEVSQLV